MIISPVYDSQFVFVLILLSFHFEKKNEFIFHARTQIGILDQFLLLYYFFHYPWMICVFVFSFSLLMTQSQLSLAIYDHLIVNRWFGMNCHLLVICNKQVHTFDVHFYRCYQPMLNHYCFFLSWFWFSVFSASLFSGHCYTLKFFVIDIQIRGAYRL